jgi:hypothetical protein
MPNVGSWNGKFTGEGHLNCIVKSYPVDSPIPKKVLSMKHGYRYDFGDGWSVNIKATEITGKEKPKYKKESKGFYGYEWMVKEIEEFGRIRTVTERRQEEVLKKEVVLNDVR